MGDAAFTALTTQRLVLRRFRPQDLDAFVAYRSDPEIARYQGWEVPYRRGQAQQFLQELEAIDPDTPGEWFQFAISLRGADGLIGDCGAQVRTEDSRQAEIGFTLAPQHQGYGYATEAVRRLLHYLLIERGKHRSGPPAMTATRARPPCWSWWACAARATCWRAPGPRASGPTTCCMPSCVANGPPAPEPSVRHGTSVRSMRRRTFTPTPSMNLNRRLQVRVLPRVRARRPHRRHLHLAAPGTAQLVRRHRDASLSRSW
jgi:GNAT superfamily N-acetyltransferase